MQKFLDNGLAIAGSLLLHAVILALLFAGFSWDRPAPAPIRTTLKATVVSDEAFRLADDDIELSPAPAAPPVTPEPAPALPPEPQP
ncbi:MAG: hypothetical protein AAF270_11535, partial [Pseudomonadota bacterium]